MDFRTKVAIQKQKHSQIDYNSELFLLGSCFASNITNKLSYYQFKNSANPLGILFHPLAIEKLVSKAINKDTYVLEDIFTLNEQWHCFDAHSSLSSVNQQELLDTLNNALQTTFQQLSNASHISITLGTAWVYRHIASDTMVANCHKVPNKQFLKELLSVDEIANSLQAIVSLIKDANPKAVIIFTVSPVRHLKDGFIENTRSKAHLISAVHQIVEPRNQTFYFPSYELLIDELRDYRFYTEDMVHPSLQAINYVWEQFVNTWMSNNTIETMKTVDAIQKGIAHRPFNPNGKKHKEFLLKLNEKIEDISNQFPHMSF